MKTQIFFCFLIILLYPFSSINAQETEFGDIPSITPPSPTAYELGKYGQIPVGLFTGTPSVSIPLLEYGTKNLKIPISLSYNSNGIKVDQLSTNVGLGWSLNTGGVISRIVRDKADEDNIYFFPEEEISTAGKNSPMVLDFLYAAGEENVDTETDLFMYNFNGYSGKFVIDNDKKIIALPKSDLKIENYAEGYKTGFKITDGTGVEYYFLEEEVTINRMSGGGHSPPDLPVITGWYLSRIEHPLGDILNFEYANNNYSYIGHKSQQLQVMSPTYQESCGTNVSGGVTILPSPSTTYNNEIIINGKRLIKIYSNKESAGTVEMNSDISHPEIPAHYMVTGIELKDKFNKTIENVQLKYLFTDNKRSFLKKVEFADPNKFYELNYWDASGFPERLSYSQDHWGFYNGKNNNFIFPNPKTLEAKPTVLNSYDNGADKNVNPDFAVKGLLKKIKYPTKGHTIFFYEANSYFGEKALEPSKKSLSLTADTGELERGNTYDDTGSVSVSYNQEVEIFMSSDFNRNLCSNNFDTGKAMGTFSIVVAGTTEYVPLKTISGYGNYIDQGSSYNVRQGENAKLYAYLEAGKTYTVRLHPTADCVFAGATLWYHYGAGTTKTNIPIGGLRIQKVENYSTETDKSEIKRFYYGKKESLNISSGEYGRRPYYYSNFIKRIPCQLPCSFSDLNYLRLNSNSLGSLYNSSGTNTTSYEFVTESIGGDNFENGGIEHKYIVHNDQPGKLINGEPIESAVWSNSGWDNGLEIETSTFMLNEDQDVVVLNKINKNYKKDNRAEDFVYGYAVNKKYELVCSGDVTYECKEEDKSRVFEYRYCATEHKHLWAPLPFDGTNDWVCIRPDAENVVRYVPHPCNNDNGQTIITHPENIQNLDVMEYKTYSYWYYLESSINTVYDSNGENPVSVNTKYYYDNPEHLQLTKTETLDSKGNTVTSRSFYPDDVTSLTVLGYDPLSDAAQNSEWEAISKLKSGNLHIISAPIQKEVMTTDSNGDILSTTAQRTVYKDSNSFVLPETLEISKNLGELEPRLVYEKYDSFGNIEQVKKKDGTSMVIIWGYEKQYPIAKIENATYSQIASALGVNTTALDDFDENNLLDINGLRSNASLSGTMITTYEYKPLVGITKVTDAKGNTTTYEYDSFNRLEFVKDESGNILKEHKYHYQTNLTN